MCYIHDNQYNNLVNLERELEITILEVFQNLLLIKFNKLHTRQPPRSPTCPRSCPQTGVSAGRSFVLISNPLTSASLDRTSQQFLQGVHRQISRSEDLEKKQETKFQASMHGGKW